MAKKTGPGEYVCGQCGRKFDKPHALKVHIGRSHGPKKKATKAAAKPAKRVASTGGKKDLLCSACGKGPMNNPALSAHSRFCKGKAAAPAIKKPVPSLLSEDGTTLIEQLRARAEQHRQDAVRIDEEIAVFAKIAQTFLKT